MPNSKLTISFEFSRWAGVGCRYHGTATIAAADAWEEGDRAISLYVLNGVVCHAYSTNNLWLREFACPG